MTTEPSSPARQPAMTRPTASTRPPGAARPPQQRVVTISSPGPLLGAILTVLLGVALGIANQGASGVDMALRVPALLAALLMVGQGVFDIKRHLPRRRVIEETPERVIVDDSGGGARSTELAVVRNLPPPQPITPVAVRPTAATLSVPIIVMVLAAWLGLADLNVSAPASLSVLSLIASFALFALGWSLLPARR
jgi:nitrate/nitrite transporter NarK